MLAVVCALWLVCPQTSFAMDAVPHGGLPPYWTGKDSRSFQNCAETQLSDGNNWGDLAIVFHGRDRVGKSELISHLVQLDRQQISNSDLRQQRGFHRYDNLVSDDGQSTVHVVNTAAFTAADCSALPDFPFATRSVVAELCQAERPIPLKRLYYVVDASRDPNQDQLQADLLALARSYGLEAFHALRFVLNKCDLVGRDSEIADLCGLLSDQYRAFMPGPGLPGDRFLIVSAAQCIGQLVQDINAAHESADLLQDAFHMFDDIRMNYYAHVVNDLIRALMDHGPESDVRYKLISGFNLDPIQAQTLDRLCSSDRPYGDDDIVDVIAELIKFKFVLPEDRIRFVSACCSFCVQAPTDSSIFIKTVLNALIDADPHLVPALWRDSSRWFVPVLIKFKKYGPVGHLCRLAPDGDDLAVVALTHIAPDGVFAICRFLFGLFQGRRRFHAAGGLLESAQKALSEFGLLLLIEPDESSAAASSSIETRTPSSSPWSSYALHGESRSVFVEFVDSAAVPSAASERFFVALCVEFARDDCLDRVPDLIDHYVPMLHDRDLCQVWRQLTTPATFLQIDRDGLLLQTLQVPSSLYDEAFQDIVVASDLRRFDRNPAPLMYLLENLSLPDGAVRAALARAASRPGASALISAYKQLKGLHLPDPFISDLMVVEGSHGGCDLINMFAEESQWEPTPSGYLLQCEIRRYEASRVLMKVPDPMFADVRPLCAKDFELFQ